YEKTAANLLFGGVPEGASFEKAIKHYKTAIQIRPDYILYYYDLAVTYEEIDEDQKAIASLEKAIKLRPITPDDPGRLKNCRELLVDLK
ncbi:MAG: tetratricopeptide repeat protein, partial [Bacteroidetes bacterium]|nr:tetratricopeptide repeat protein [Bacteroidota bacterium]